MVLTKWNFLLARYGLYPLAHLGLGWAKALVGNNDEPRRAYEDFLELWKDADPISPVLQEAKAEYAKLLETGENVPTNSAFARHWGRSRATSSSWWWGRAWCSHLLASAWLRRLP